MPAGAWNSAPVVKRQGAPPPARPRAGGGWEGVPLTEKSPDEKPSAFSRRTSSSTRQRALFNSSVFFRAPFTFLRKSTKRAERQPDPTRGRRSEELLRWRGLESRSARLRADASDE